MGCLALLQGIFPTQRLKLGLLYCMQILYHMSHLVTFKILFCLLRSLITVCLGVNSFNLIMFGIHPASYTCELIQFSSVTLSCLTLCNPMDCSMPGLPVHHQLLEPARTHVHQVGGTIQLSHPLSTPSPPTLNLSQDQGLFQ